jgi:hypothetical protein
LSWNMERVGGVRWMGGEAVHRVASSVDSHQVRHVKVRVDSDGKSAAGLSPDRRRWSNDRRPLRPYTSLAYEPRTNVFNVAIAT